VNGDAGGRVTFSRISRCARGIRLTSRALGNGRISQYEKAGNHRKNTYRDDSESHYRPPYLKNTVGRDSPLPRSIATFVLPIWTQLQGHQQRV